MYSKIEEKYNYLAFFEEKLNSFGGESRNKKKFKLRKNVNEPFPAKGAFFGCINEEEDSSGPYSDLSIVVFPSNEETNENDRWIIALGVGSLGYKNDYNIVSLLGTRRLFMKYLCKNSFIKNDFLDIESAEGFSSFLDENDISDTLTNAVCNYKKVIIAATIFDPNKEDFAKEIISKYLALYACIRRWPSNNEQRKAIRNILKREEQISNDENNVAKLLEKRKYVVLQGAPGTGKTRLAKKLPEDNDIVFFTQFHAETTYSDFIYGVMPDVKSENLKYSEREGIFVKAIKEALKQENQNKKIYLIIDEINRANLSNVLGVAFYLFEPTMIENDVIIEICPGLSLSKLPKNFYVIATMNTADRSLAVVDFALRRRFAWYTLFPHKIIADPGLHFCEDEYNAISDIFEKYASDEELNLQPGHSYSIVSDKEPEEIEIRLKYEIMPLIKEYLLDGMLSRAKDDFIHYFRKRIKEEMFR